MREHEVILQRAFGAQPDQVRTEWRYRVMGNDSGQLREVDVALFVEAGYRTLFIAIECRDRAGRQGLPWIEQLVAKKRDIGADRMVAVARDGFTRFARQSALANNIEAYTLAERDSYGDGKTLAEIALTQWFPQVRIVGFRWAYRASVLDPGAPLPKLSREEAASVSRNFDCRDWLDNDSHEPVSLKEILVRTLTWEALLAGVPGDGGHRMKSITTEFSSQTTRYTLDRHSPDCTWIALASITGEFDVWRELRVIPASRITQYRDSNDEPVIELHEYDGKVWGLDGQTVFFAPVAERQ